MVLWIVLVADDILFAKLILGNKGLGRFQITLAFTHRHLFLGLRHCWQDNNARVRAGDASRSNSCTGKNLDLVEKGFFSMCIGFSWDICTRGYCENE